MIRRVGRKLRQIRKRSDIYLPIPSQYQFVMSEPERAIFDRAVSKSRVYLEFGLGGSTLRALLKSRAKIYSVESSSQWIAFMRRYILIRWMEKIRLSVLHIDIGPTVEWGYPGPDNPRDTFESYSSHVFNVIDGEYVDLVLIDGRFRVACTLKSILQCHDLNPGILFHDFWNREHYHMILRYLNTEDRADTLGLFSLKTDIDLEAVEREYQAYKYDPR